MELSSLDLHYVVQELQYLQGGKIEKIFQSDANKRDLLFIIYSQPRINLRFLLPGVIAAAKEKPNYPQSPPGFAMFLRKYLGGTRITAVRQRGFDRIMEIDLASKTDSYTLLIELIPPGNMLLLDKEMRIINLIENQQFKDRQLRGRQPYIAPPPSFDIKDATEAGIAERIAVSTRDTIVTTLAIHLGLGGVYAEEVCARAGIAKHRNDLSNAEVKLIAHQVKEIALQPIAANTDGKRAYPFRMASRETKQSEETGFLSAIATFIEDAPADHVERKEHKVKKDKLQAIIDAQGKQATKLEEDAKSEQRKAERIYEEYQVLSEILHAAREARERKQSISEALKRFPQVKCYKDATGEIEVELEGE